MVEKDIILQLVQKGIFKENELSYKKLDGGTSSHIVIIEDIAKQQYILKCNESSIIQEEIQFLHFYQDICYFPKVLYRDSSFEYFIYHFLKGSTIQAHKNKKAVLVQLTENVFNYYKPLSTINGWGWTNYPCSSWHEFSQNEVASVEEIIGSHLLNSEDIKLVHNIMKRLEKKHSLQQPYLLHGDCGFHNFLFIDETISGVIDPMPLIGDPLHDLLFAFCSSPADLTKETIHSVVTHLSTWDYDTKSLNYHVLISLFIRMARCSMHHPDDLPTYLLAWSYWKEIIEQDQKNF
ncbi:MULTISPECIES: phosphotransferase [Bacillus]|uniref:phosphotransferase n=1 Tax=Bacillus TaxID=1386 RepID=UPI000300A2A8|nr:MULTISPECIES: phosphotransferase [Bacillus]